MNLFSIGYSSIFSLIYFLSSISLHFAVVQFIIKSHLSVWSVLLYFLFLYVMLLLSAFVNRIQFLPYLYCFYSVSNLMIHFNYPTSKFHAVFFIQVFLLDLDFSVLMWNKYLRVKVDFCPTTFHFSSPLFILVFTLFLSDVAVWLGWLSPFSTMLNKLAAQLRFVFKGNSLITLWIRFPYSCSDAFGYCEIFLSKDMLDISD